MTAGGDALDVRSILDDRFARFRLIPWWDQEVLARARILVVGAGALGNEVVKNLALLGVGHLAVVDFDRVETSNLTRSPLFREGDRGRPKAEAIAEAARGIYPGIRARGLALDVVHDAGFGLFRWADVTIGGLDNREARHRVNLMCRRAGKPWIDGGIDVFQGVARVFAPDGPCYECTMNAADWKLMRERRSCSLLARDLAAAGHVPTTPTVASVVAGVMCGEALKLLHGLETIAGRGFYFDGRSLETDVVAYTEKADCTSHEFFERVVEMPWRSDRTTLAEAVADVRAALGPAAAVEAIRDLPVALACGPCGTSREAFRSGGPIRASDARCPRCGAPEAPTFAHRFTGDEPFAGRTLAALGLPPFDALAGRVGLEETHFLAAGDAPAVLPAPREEGTP